MFGHFRTLFLYSVIILLVSACGPNAAQIEATARSLASTDIALTMAAMPTNTLTPTETATYTPTETSTSTVEPSATATATSAPLSNVDLSPYGQASMATFDAARANKQNKYTPLYLENLSGERVQFIITSPQYQEFVLTDSTGIVLPYGTYTYLAWIGNTGPLSGSFFLNNPDKHVLTFYSNKIHFSTP